MRQELRGRRMHNEESDLAAVWVLNDNLPFLFSLVLVDHEFLDLPVGHWMPILA
jgi:hypothetical protein